MVVPLQNGVDVVDRLVTLGVPRERILGGLTAIAPRGWGRASSNARAPCSG